VGIVYQLHTECGAVRGGSFKRRFTTETQRARRRKRRFTAKAQRTQRNAEKRRFTTETQRAQRRKGKIEWIGEMRRQMQIQMKMQFPELEGQTQESKDKTKIPMELRSMNRSFLYKSILSAIFFLSMGPGVVLNTFADEWHDAREQARKKDTASAAPTGSEPVMDSVQSKPDTTPHHYAMPNAGVHGAEFFTDKGSIWASGSLSYAIATDNFGVPANVIDFAPVIRFFPTRYFVLGPAGSWCHYYGDDYYSGYFSLGLEWGYAYGNHTPLIPYVLTDLQYVHAYDEYTDYDYYGNKSVQHSVGDGFQFALQTGAMMPIMDGLGLQLEAGLAARSINWQWGGSYSVCSISIGICSIGKRTALSLLGSYTNDRVLGSLF
jgi:hypothetical protein